MWSSLYVLRGKNGENEGIESKVLRFAFSSFKKVEFNLTFGTSKSP